MSEQVKLKAFLAAVLDDYKLGAISQQQAVGGITSLVDAIEISDSGKIVTGSFKPSGLFPPALQK